MCPRLLLAPAPADTDLTIAHAVSVPDDEVIGHATRKASHLPVKVLDARQVARGARRVMNDDRTPPALMLRRSEQCGQWLRRRASTRSLWRSRRRIRQCTADAYTLSRLDLVWVFQRRVECPQLGQRESIPKRNRGERVASPNDVNLAALLGARDVMPNEQQRHHEYSKRPARKEETQHAAC